VKSGKITLVKLSDVKISYDCHETLILQYKHWIFISTLLNVFKDKIKLLINKKKLE